ncbi:MAG: DUF4361 domain-containing protein [Bacteroidales bacterium]|nr:DUF4361 domain-containing protein [Bacteroidales bacterium]
MKINKIILSLASLAVVCFVSCSKNDVYDREMYKYVIYLLSEKDHTYTEAYSLNSEDTVRYFSVGCGGSTPNEEEVTVVLEPDTELLGQYNKSNFDIDTASFAVILPQSRYEIASYTVVIPAHSTDQYAKVPVKVRPEGLSPDTIYFIPIAIKSVSKYEVHPDKYNLLYRVTIENDYAEQKNVTFYYQRGTIQGTSATAPRSLSGTKTVQPLTKNQVRMFAGDAMQAATSTVADIKKHSIIVEIAEDNTLTVKPYGSIEVELIPQANYNIYTVTEGISGKDEYWFYLSYRYRTLTKPAEGGNPAEYSEWYTVRESLQRMETE